jgi:Flp pilus assembly protein TadD
VRRPPPKPSARPPPSDRSLERAHERFRDADYGGALSIANQILSRDPENTDALILASQCHSLQGHYDRAVALDRRAVEAHPKNPQAWMTLAFDVGNMGDLDAAEEAYRRTVELDPARGSAWYRLACIAARRGDVEEALADLERACAAQPEYREESKSQPEFAPLLEDPRFTRIVEGEKATDDPYAEWMRSKT